MTNFHEIPTFAPCRRRQFSNVTRHCITSLKDHVRYEKFCCDSSVAYNKAGRIAITPPPRPRTREEKIVI